MYKKPFKGVRRNLPPPSTPLFRVIAIAVWTYYIINKTEFFININNCHAFSKKLWNLNKCLNTPIQGDFRFTQNSLEGGGIPETPHLYFPIVIQIYYN